MGLEIEGAGSREGRKNCIVDSPALEI